MEAAPAHPPALLGLFSVVTPLAYNLGAEAGLPVRRASWCQKAQPTFADTLAAVHQYLWSQAHFPMPHAETQMVKIPKALFVRFTDTLCYAA